MKKNEILKNARLVFNQRNKIFFNSKMFLITLCLCLFSSVVVALPPGSGFLKVVTDKTNYRTDDTITVTVSN